MSDPLTPEHRDYLRRAAITDDVIDAAGVFSRAQGFYGCPEIVFPWFRPAGEVVEQIRPDVPPASLPKYLFPASTVPVVSVHPLVRERVADASVPILIVEGTKQYLAAVSHLPEGHAAVGIGGCTGWVHEGAAVPDMAAIPWEGREVIVAFDADTATNHDVWVAASALTEVLLTNGASLVRYAEVPGMGKAGLDDALAAAPDPRTALANIIRRAKPKLPRKPARKKGKGRVAANVAPCSAPVASVIPGLTRDVAPVAGVALPPLAGDSILQEIFRALTSYVVFPSRDHAVAVTLYAATTHAAGSLQVAPRLRVKSPVMRCGKSRLLEVLEPLVRSPLATANISAAALVRSVNPNGGTTLIFDEMDTVFGKTAAGDEKAEILRGVFNAGFNRGKPYIRYNAMSCGIEEFPTFAMAILAGIGNLPDTIEDRSVIIALQRKTSADKVARFRLRRDVPALRELGAQAGAWVATVADAIGTAEPPAMAAGPWTASLDYRWVGDRWPDGLSDRAQDLWEPLVAVADAAGGQWPALARHVAVVLAGEAADADADSSRSTRLLADLRDVFGTDDALWTTEITGKLGGLETSPWAGWNHGRGLTPSDLAGLLRPFGIGPKDVRNRDLVRKGYRREQFTHAWQAYAPSADLKISQRFEYDASGGSATPATDATSQVSPQMTDATQPLHSRYTIRNPDDHGVTPVVTAPQFSLPAHFDPVQQALFVQLTQGDAALTPEQRELLASED
jgi:hypothetical protein